MIIKICEHNLVIFTLSEKNYIFQQWPAGSSATLNFSHRNISKTLFVSPYIIFFHLRIKNVTFLTQIQNESWSRASLSIQFRQRIWERNQLVQLRFDRFFFHNKTSRSFSYFNLGLWIFKLIWQRPWYVKVCVEDSTIKTRSLIPVFMLYTPATHSTEQTTKCYTYLNPAWAADLTHLE